MHPLSYPSTPKGRAIIAHGRVQRPEGCELRYHWRRLRRDCERIRHRSVEPEQQLTNADQLNARCRSVKSKGDARREGKERGEC